MSDQKAGSSYRAYHLATGDSPPGASRVDSRAVAFIAALLVLVGLCGILYVGQASKVYVLRRRLADGNREQVRYYRENAILLARIARTGASENLGAWAVDLGYALVGNPHYVAFSYAPLPSQTTFPASERPDASSAVQADERQEGGGWVVRLTRWGEDMLEQFIEWIDLAAIRDTGNP